MNKLQEILDEFLYITEDMDKCRTKRGINSFRNAIYIFIEDRIPEYTKAKCRESLSLKSIKDMNNKNIKNHAAYILDLVDQDFIDTLLEERTKEMLGILRTAGRGIASANTPSAVTNYVIAEIEKKYGL